VEAKLTQAQIADEAELQFSELIGDLVDVIVAEAPVARRKKDRIELGTGALKWGIPFRSVDASVFAGTGWDVAFGAYIEVSQPNEIYPGRSANLWYAKAPAQTEYRCWEMPYMTHPLSQRGSANRHEPFAFMSGGDLRFAAESLRPVMGIYQLAAAPKLVDDDQFDDFSRRWGTWLAAAAERKLERPRTLPE
jgi:hypothetical protein